MQKAIEICYNGLPKAAIRFAEPMKTPEERSQLKKSLRANLVKLRNQLDRRSERSERICARLIELDLFQQARAIHVYLAIRSEVDTLLLINHALQLGKRVAVPVVVPQQPTLEHRWLEAAALEQLSSGEFGTRHPPQAVPCDPNEIDLIIVPLLGFDRRCQRLGYGKGYYDRFLAHSSATAIGLGFAIQEVPELPNEAHDIPLRAIVTEQEVLYSPTS
jgi:5,10-methenyltetrahydrofolate synthetase